MKKDLLTRRDFLRLSVIATGSAIAAACQNALTPIPLISTAAASPAPSAKLRVVNGNVDAWAWVKQIKVGVSAGECERVLLQVNGQPFDAKPDGDSFTADVPLSEGENEVSATCITPAGEEVPSESVVYTQRLRQVPTATIQISIDGGQIVLDGSPSVAAPGTETAIVEYVWAAREGNPARLQELVGEVKGQSISLTPPTTDGEYYVRLQVRDQEGREDTSTTYFVVENGEPRIPDYDMENPAWIETAVVYGIIPFLFGSPAFAAIRERLDELVDLGINAIWLGPINVHPADDYGYAVEDYFKLDPAYGTEQDFRDLVQAAHEVGIRVLMDFVPNHTSNTHPYFKDAQRGPESPYWDFYDRDAEGNYTYYFEWSNLPNLNYDNPEVRQMMMEAFSYWVREFDVDGFRVDVVWGVRERYPEFWLEWRRALKRIKPDLMLLAEASAREPYYFENGFDVAYDWTYAVGNWAWNVVWTAYKLRLLSYNLTDALTNRPEGFPPDAVIFRFLNNNDTGDRFITRYGEGVTRVATALLLTVPGVPSIYTGDEYGLAFEPYQQLEPLVFEEQYPGLREYHKKLIALRKDIPSLHSRLWSLITPDAVPQTVFSYIRYADTGEAPVLVLLNFSEEPAVFSFDVPSEFGTVSEGNLYDLMTDESVLAVVDGRIHVTVPAQTVRLLTHEATS
ncbi:MAG TPA: alpha-amylase family glycosyl hydrolase [Anaerolineales bacterium]|nr:alpha-amylase family glycosyl hydrolase [Anaerolineales bacterium]